ncbi:hypothetical protein [Streptomyces sp. NPDC048623]|uniref:hypothetical protein n=1 Tax=Streptomyces sp. NPDC048623 TaxID=3155761 RepID=UPI00341EF56F
MKGHEPDAERFDWAATVRLDAPPLLVMPISSYSQSLDLGQRLGHVLQRAGRLQRWDWTASADLTLRDLRTAAAVLDLSETGQAEPADARTRVRAAAEELRSASTAEERRTAARNFLSALAAFFVCLLRFLVRVLILLLSRLLGRVAADDVPAWKPDPIDAAPKITPRGPNTVFPVATYRGGRHSSAQGSAVLAA